MKRRLSKLGVFLLLGAIVNVAVAWGCALTVSARAMDAAEGRLSQDEVVSLFRTRVEIMGADSILAYGQRIERFGRTLEHVQLRQSFSSGVAQGRADQLMIWREGWPLRALTCEILTDYGGLRAIPRPVGQAWWMPDLITVDRRAELMTFALPLTPIWPGFAINTIFYAAVLWLLFAAPGRIRRWRRIRRGQCPACAYPVGESETCTECGKALPLGRGGPQGSNRSPALAACSTHP